MIRISQEEQRDPKSKSALANLGINCRGKSQAQNEKSMRAAFSMFIISGLEDFSNVALRHSFNFDLPQVRMNINKKII